MFLALTLVVLLFMGMPIYIAMGLTTMLFMATDPGMDVTLLVKTMYAGADQYPLIAVTGFILVGNLFEKAGITQEVVDLAKSVMGRSKSGLAVVTILSCAIFAAVSGSGPATVATVGGLMIPAMLRAGYPPNYAGAVAASGGALGVLIPPSNPFLMYGIIARESIAALFMAGVLPGFLMACVLSFTARLTTRRFTLADGGEEEFAPAEKKSAAFIVKALWNAKRAISAMVLLLGGIYAGFFTPIEAAEVTAFYTIGIGLLVTRTMTIRDIWDALVRTMVMSGTLLILVAIATSFGRLITLYELPDAIGAAFASFTDNPQVLLLCISGLLLFTGVWAETFSMIVVLTPVFLPVIVKLGIDPMQFGVIFVVCCEIGFLTPPFGCNLFVAMKMTNQPIEAIFKSVLPFILTYLIVLIALIWFPSISLFLPKLLYG